LKMAIALDEPLVLLQESLKRVMLLFSSIYKGSRLFVQVLEINLPKHDVRLK
jgi:hypothetical protein